MRGRRKEMLQSNPAVKAQEFHRRIILPISNEIAAELKDHSPFFFLVRLGATFSAAAADWSAGAISSLRCFRSSW